MLARAAPTAVPADLGRRAFVKKCKLGLSDVIHIKTANLEYKMLKSHLTCFFDIPACDVARIMRICLTLLKRLRMWSGIQRWPYTLVNRGAYHISLEDIRKERRELIARMEGDVLCSKEAGFLMVLKAAETFSAAYWRASSVKSVRSDAEVNQLRDVRTVPLEAVKRALDLRRSDRNLSSLAASMLSGLDSDAGMKSTDSEVDSTAVNSTGANSTPANSTVAVSTNLPQSTAAAEPASDLQWLNAVDPDHYIVPFNNSQDHRMAPAPAAAPPPEPEGDDGYGLLGLDCDVFGCPTPQDMIPWTAFSENPGRVYYWENVRGWVLNH